MLCLFGAFGGLLLCVSLYGQLGEGWSPIHAGLTLTPMVVGMIVGMVVSGMLVERLGRHLLHIGILLIAAGTATLAAHADRRAQRLHLGPRARPALVGAGVGTVLGQLIQFILAAVSMNEVGSASGVMEASQQLSTALGVAVLGTIFFSLFEHHPAADALRVTAWVPGAAGSRLRLRLPAPDAPARRSPLARVGRLAHRMKDDVEDRSPGSSPDTTTSIPWPASSMARSSRPRLISRCQASACWEALPVVVIVRG